MTTSPSSIPDEAVEAAARALDPHTMGSGGALAEKFKDATRAEARRALEAAAPYMLGAEYSRGFDDGHLAGQESMEAE